MRVNFYNFLSEKRTLFQLLNNVKTFWVKNEFRMIEIKTLHVKMRQSRLLYDIFYEAVLYDIFYEAVIV